MGPIRRRRFDDVSRTPGPFSLPPYLLKFVIFYRSSSPRVVKTDTSSSASWATAPHSSSCLPAQTRFCRIFSLNLLDWREYLHPSLSPYLLINSLSTADAEVRRIPCHVCAPPPLRASRWAGPQHSRISRRNCSLSGLSWMGSSSACGRWRRLRVGSL